jgi:hypothetical protein
MAKKNGSKVFMDLGGSRDGGDPADYAGVNREVLFDLILTATSKGGAIRLGYTRDGGAYAIGLYYGDDYSTQYIRPGEDFVDRVLGFTRMFESLPILSQKKRE